MGEPLFNVRNRETGYLVLPSGTYEQALSGAKSWAASMQCEVTISSRSSGLAVAIVDPDGEVRQA